jgi:hypothetical protein
MSDKEKQAVETVAVGYKILIQENKLPASHPFLVQLKALLIRFHSDAFRVHLNQFDMQVASVRTNFQFTDNAPKQPNTQIEPQTEADPNDGLLIDALAGAADLGSVDTPNVPVLPDQPAVGELQPEQDRQEQVQLSLENQALQTQSPGVVAVSEPTPVDLSPDDMAHIAGLAPAKIIAQFGETRIKSGLEILQVEVEQDWTLQQKAAALKAAIKASMPAKK